MEAHGAAQGTRPRKLGLRESSQVATSRLFLGDTLPGGAATGFAAEFWFLSRAALTPEELAEYTTAFLILSNSVVVIALVVFGMLLGVGLVPGDLPTWLTIFPAACALAVILAVLAAARYAKPARAAAKAEGWEVEQSRAHRVGAMVRGLLQRMPMGVKDAAGSLGRPAVVTGLIINPLFDAASFWLCYRAVGTPLPLAVMLMAYCLGQVGALIPTPGGIGGVQGMAILALVSAGAPAKVATAGVLAWTGVSLATQLVWGGIGYIRLQRTMRVWERAAARLGARPQ